MLGLCIPKSWNCTNLRWRGPLLQVRQAASEAALAHGSGPRSSALVGGYTAQQAALEQDLARLKGRVTAPRQGSNHAARATESALTQSTFLAGDPVHIKSHRYIMTVELLVGLATACVEIMRLVLLAAEMMEELCLDMGIGQACTTFASPLDRSHLIGLQARMLRCCSRQALPPTWRWWRH